MEACARLPLGTSVTCPLHLVDVGSPSAEMGSGAADSVKFCYLFHSENSECGSQSTCRRANVT